MAINLDALIANNEFYQIKDYLSRKKVKAYTNNEKKAYVLLKAYELDVEDALLHFNVFKLDDLHLKGRMLFLAGEYDECIQLADRINCEELKVESFMAQGQFSFAIKALEEMEINADWYYYMARCLKHTEKCRRAIKSMEKAYKLYEQDLNLKQMVAAASNLASYYDYAGEVNSANKYYKRAASLIRDEYFKSLSQTKARFYINYGFFLLENSKTYEGIRYQLRAVNLLKNTSSSDYNRAVLLLANSCNEIGHFQRSIDLLSNITPKKTYLKIDRLRYLANAYGKLNKVDLAFKYIKQAKELLTDEDTFSKIYLSYDEMELHLKLNDKEKARELLTYATSLARSDDDEEAYYYGLSRYYSNADEQPESWEHLSFHLERNLKHEFINDLLLQARLLASKGKLDQAKECLSDIKARVQFLPSYFKKQISELEKNLSSSSSIMLNLSKDELIINGEINPIVKKYPKQWSFIKYLANRPGELIEKEELATQVFGKRVYDPRSDNNKIYVTVNRIKKHFGLSDLIEVEDGKYRINSTSNTTILSAS